MAIRVVIVLISALVAIGVGQLSFAQSQVGVWQNVTPANADVTNPLDCSNFGTQFVVVDPTRPSDLYADFNCQGTWKSTDYGQTFTGPINTGPGGAAAGNGASGGLAIAANGTNPPILYKSGIRSGSIGGIGFWRSLDGGVSWTNFNVAPAGGRQDLNVPVVDPYDSNHLILSGHELAAVYQSTDGGMTWASVTLAAGMNEPGGTAGLAFVNTGTAATTRGTWLWIAQGTDGTYGTWRTTNGGTSWAKVERVEHAHGTSQVYQPDTSGTIYVAGLYSALGWGVLRSTDYGATWAHVGGNGSQNDVFGTPNRVYAGWGWACAHCNVDPSLQSAAQPGLTGWANITRPPVMTEGLASSAVTFDGTSYVIVTANWTGGLYRYVEPASGIVPTPTSTPLPGAATATPTPSATPVPAVPNTIRINAGGPAYTDVSGNVWSGDSFVSGGQVYSTADQISSTADPTLYQTERYRNFTYSIPVTPGTYTVTLKFAELYWTAAGKRVFNVAIGGTPALSNFDVWAAAGGKDVAVDKTFTTSVSGGTLAISFVSVVDNAKVDAIEVAPVVAATPTPASTPQPTLTPTITPTAAASPTDTPTPTPTQVCTALGSLNGVVTNYTRPLAFCTNQ